jgi:hypothetical protein
MVTVSPAAQEVSTINADEAVVLLPTTTLLRMVNVASVRPAE